MDKTEEGKLVFRKRKIKPFGREDHIGYGEESYEKKFGEYFAPVTNKRRERRQNKIDIRNLPEDE